MNKKFFALAVSIAFGIVLMNTVAMEKENNKEEGGHAVIYFKAIKLSIAIQNTLE